MSQKFIDVEKILKDKNPAILKWTPSFLINYLKRTIHQDEINQVLSENKNKFGYEFCQDIIDRFNIKVVVQGTKNIPKTGGCILASNHPLGGMDAMAIVTAINPHRSDIQFIVNDILLNLKNLKGLFVGVNKHGGNSKESLNNVNNLFASDKATFIFPAGLVSRKKRGKIEDLEWKKAFITQSKKHNKPIIPVYVEGNLTQFFYNLSNFRSSIGIKANIEMLYLAKETFKQRNKTIKVIFGEPIPSSTFDKSKHDKKWANWVKEKVYEHKGKGQEMTENKIIPPANAKLIEKELNENTFVRNTNKAHNEIYIVNYHNSPNTVREIGRLRELTFSDAGGGTGKEIDLDSMDTSDNCYDQLIVYDRDAQIISSGYRFIDCAKVLNGKNDDIELSTRHYFNFSEQFITEYLPHTIELGRSWVHPDYQAGKSRKGLFALDNLWDGLGAIMVNNPEMKYFYGKVTMYTSYNTEARDALYYFMNNYFPDPENLATPIHPVNASTDTTEITELLKNKNFDDGAKSLHHYLKERGEKIPPLINTYMKLSPTMKSFGTAMNPDFGGVEETGILVTVADIYPEKKERHLDF